MKSDTTMKRTSIILCLLIAASSLFAQTGEQEAGNAKKNLLKLNLTALLLKNYSVQYERVLSKSYGVALSFRTMPNTTVPLKGILLDLSDDDQDTKDVLDKLRLSNYAITPEFRFYPGSRGYGRGFYIAPYYRYAKFKSNDVVYDYNNNTESITLRGKFSSHSGGLMLGAQWFLGKSISLDWWIIGAHFGAGNGTFDGLTDHTLTPQEQADLRQSLDDTDIPFGQKQVNVTANGASIKLTGGWPGLRAGLSLGFRF